LYFFPVGIWVTSRRDDRQQFLAELISVVPVAVL
jgi:hypothetical protein